MKIAIATLAAIIAVAILIGGIGQAIVTALFGSGNTQPSQEALADIPGDYLALYQAAAPLCPGLDWSILAAIGKIESDHGRSKLDGVADGTENDYGAGGPMQFKARTFAGVLARHQLPAGGKNPPSRYNPHDAIHAAAFLLCDDGARDGRDLRGALWNYNHDNTYVNDVLAQAKKYSQPTRNISAACPMLQQTVQQRTQDFSGSPAMVAVAFACAQLGKPYVWGGNGDPGFDCSGLTHAAYQAAGISLPRTAQTQYNAGPLLPPGTSPAPGDLLFFGTPGRVHHVGIALGGTAMVHAPTFGEPVQIGDYRAHRDFLAVSRPSGGRLR